MEPGRGARICAGGETVKESQQVSETELVKSGFDVPSTGIF